MSLLRQGRAYAAIGVLQWLLDWAVMVLTSHVGVPIGIANLLGRVSGALLGFWLNGSITFAGDAGPPGWRHFRRYAALWLFNSVLSTAAVIAIDRTLGLRWAWLAKPAIEACLAIGSFLGSRHWVYR